MNAADIMIRQVVKVKEYDTVKEVLERLIAYRISGLPVVNDRNEIVGMIGYRDIMKRIGRFEPMIILAVCNPFMPLPVFYDEEELEHKLYCLISRNVMEVANRHVPVVHMNAEIDEVAALLGKKYVNKVAVENNGALVGLISRGDMMRCVSACYLTN